MKDRFKRIAAFIIDWNICGLPVLILSAVLSVYLHIHTPDENDVGIRLLVVFLILLLILLFLLLVCFRDWLFRGRSLAKRLLGLTVYDKKTLSAPRKGQLTTRNLFTVILSFFIDGILLLAIGETVGDMVAGTTVLSKKGLEKEITLRNGAFYPPTTAVPTVPTAISTPNMPPQYLPPSYTPLPYNPQVYTQPSPESKKRTTKTVLIVVGILVACFVGFIGLILGLLHAQKDTEQYKVAYHYLITSEAFSQLNADEDDIFMNQYSFHTNLSAEDSHDRETTEFTFTVKMRPFHIVCHKENEVWQVCEECTLFH